MVGNNESGWLQLELRDPLPLVKGDRFILRYPSPETAASDAIAPGRLAQTFGVERAGEATPANGGFNRQTEGNRPLPQRFGGASSGDGGNRQSRRHPNP